VDFDPTDGVERLIEQVPVRPDAGVIGEQFEDDLNTADHDEEDADGQAEPPSCCVHRLTYRYVTPSTHSDNSTGETGRVHRNAAQISDFCRYDRQPSAAATAPSTIDIAATTNTQLLTLRVAIAIEIPASHRMWPTTNPPMPATQIAALKS
jgi:hypothetical protein